MLDDKIDHRLGGRHRWRGPDIENEDRGTGTGRGRSRGHGPAMHGRGMGPGWGFPFGFGGRFGRGPAVRRGDVRAAILAVLADKPMHGYQVMQDLRERSGGAWAPSAGSIYPTLQQLEDEGLVRGEERDGRRVFTLTDEGRAAAADALKGGSPWEIGRDEAGADLGSLAMQVARAAMQVRHVGTQAAISEARRILGAARRDLYRLLAEDGAAGEEDPTPGPEAPGGAAGR